MVANENPSLIGDMLARLIAMAEAGKLRPLPAVRFAFDDAVEAYRFMAQAKHIGKVILRQPTPEVDVSSTGDYLVVGGMSGLQD